jgi:homoserine dehydrogenase
VTRVAILGLGTVGSAVARRLLDGGPASQPNLSLTHLFDRRALQKRARFAASAGSVALTECIDDVLGSDVDVVVEAIGGVDPAAAWIRSALLAGKSVVTANEQVVAHHGASLWRLAARQGRQFRFEAAVGGAMPIRRRLTAWVGPVVVPQTSIFARTIGADNAALIRGEHCGEVGIFGIGAGGSATAVAVVSDIAAIARDRAAVLPAPTLSCTFSVVPSPFSLRPSSFPLLEAV